MCDRIGGSFLAPEGPRLVATGGAKSAARRTKRNPWEGDTLDPPAPVGAGDRSPRVPDRWLEVPRIPHIPGHDPSPPWGREGTFITADHGFCSGHPGLAPPVATHLRPFRGVAQVPPVLSRTRWQAPYGMSRSRGARPWVDASTAWCGGSASDRARPPAGRDADRRTLATFV